MSYFLAPALETLRAQINDLHPERDKTSDGWIGDTSHAARESDHNPDWDDDGIVRALDIDEDLVIGLAVVGEAMPLAEALLRDPRTRYVIYEGRWAYGEHVPDVIHGWRPYTGPNAHLHHIHVSVRDVAGYDRDARPWALDDTPNQEDDMPTPQEIAKAVWDHKIPVPTELRKELGAEPRPARQIFASVLVRANRAEDLSRDGLSVDRQNRVKLERLEDKADDIKEAVK